MGRKQLVFRSSLGSEIRVTSLTFRNGEVWARGRYSGQGHARTEIEMKHLLGEPFVRGGHAPVTWAYARTEEV